MAERQEIEIARLGAQADGIADHGGAPLYVAGCLPGERVTVDIDGDRGRLVAVKLASPDRVTPPCPHFGTCGGCAAQHMSPALYASWKRGLVATAFQHRGLDVQLEDTIAIGPGRRRRATFAARRAGEKIRLGFHEEGSHTLVDLTVCPVMLPVIESALPALRAIAAVVATDSDTIRLAVTATSVGLDLVLSGVTGRLTVGQQGAVAQIAAANGIDRVTSNGDIVMQQRRPRITIGGVDILLPPGAFIQATAEAEAAISAILFDATRKAKRIADLFCGLGTFTFGLARRARVLALDTEATAIAVLAEAAKATPGVKSVETRVRDLLREPLSRLELADFGAVVFDPPRAGAKNQAETLARSKVPVVCAISCNPATLARDCRILVDAGYAIERIVPIDQFVWSPHIEAVAVLRR